MRSLLIDPSIRESFPDLRIGVMVASGINNHPDPAPLIREKTASEQRVRSTLSWEELQTHPHIAAWRETYRKFGVNPKNHRPTAEAVLRRVLKGDSIPYINAVVASYLVAELDQILPVGGYDMANVQGDIRLKFSSGGEQFRAIGADEAELTAPGEVVYSDDLGVLTRRWNYRDSDRAKITESSRSIALFCEAPVDSVKTGAIEDCLTRIMHLVQLNCGGLAQSALIEPPERRFELPLVG